MTIPEEIQELDATLSVTTDDLDQAELISEILKKGIFIKRTDTEPYIDRLLQLAERLDAPLYRARGLYFRALIKRIRGEVDTSLELSLQSLELFSKIQNKVGMSNCHNNIGLVYESLGNYAESLRNLFSALKIQEEAGNRLDMSRSYSNIGAVYWRMGNGGDALKYKFNALRIAQQLDNSNMIGVCYTNIGIQYEQDGKYAEAAENYLAALKINEKIGNRDGIGLALSNLGNVYGKQGDHTESLRCHLSALKIFEQIDAKNMVAMCFNNIGAAYYLTGHYPEALKNLLQALEMAKEARFNDLIKEIYLVLTKVYKTLGKLDSALESYEKYHEVHCEILGEQAQRQLTNLTFQHNMEQIEKNLELEKNARKLEEEKNALLSVQKQLIERSLHEREVLLREIHHRVKNNLQVIASLLELQSAGIDDEQARSAMSEGQSRVRSIALIHHKLYQNDDMAAIEFKGFVMELYKQLAAIYAGAHLDVKAVFEMDETHIDIDTAVPLGLIANELITNAFKYAFSAGQKGILSFSLKQPAGGQYELVVKDNGNGLPENTNLGKSKSLGLRLIYNLSKQIGGSSEYQYNEGSVFTVKFADTKTRKLTD